MIDYATQASALVQAIEARLTSTGSEICAQMAEAADPVLEWLGHLHQTERTGIANHCLDGIRSLLLEATASAAAGLYRSTLLSLRGQIDLTFTWLYFKDHPIEWERLMRENKGFQLKSDVWHYLDKYVPRFNVKFEILKSHKLRDIADPFSVLSAHIHSTGLDTVPSIASFSDIISDNLICQECVTLQRNVSEFIGDVLFCCFSQKWVALPTEITQLVRSRVGEEKFSALIA